MNVDAESVRRKLKFATLCAEIWRTQNNPNHAVPVTTTTSKSGGSKGEVPIHTSVITTTIEESSPPPTFIHDYDLKPESNQPICVCFFSRDSNTSSGILDDYKVDANFYYITQLWIPKVVYVMFIDQTNGKVIADRFFTSTDVPDVLNGSAWARDVRIPLWQCKESDKNLLLDSTKSRHWTRARTTLSSWKMIDILDAIKNWIDETTAKARSRSSDERSMVETPWWKYDNNLWGFVGPRKISRAFISQLRRLATEKLKGMSKSEKPLSKKQSPSSSWQRKSWSSTRREVKNNNNNNDNTFIAARIRNFNNTCIKLRMSKSQLELTKIKNTLSATVECHNIMRDCLRQKFRNATTSGRASSGSLRESDFDALAWFAFKRRGMTHAYPPIAIGSSKASTELHGIADPEVILDVKQFKESEIVPNGTILLDIAARGPGGYATDITRTYACRGRFTDRERRIYQILMTAFKLAETKWIQRGMFILRPTDVAPLKKSSIHNRYEKWIKRHFPTKYDNFVAHSVGHHIGLEVHEKEPLPLDTGHVFALEFGYYSKEENIGIRIEDMYCIVSPTKEKEIGRCWECLSQTLDRDLTKVEFT